MSVSRTKRELPGQNEKKNCEPGRDRYDRIEKMPVKLILRDKEYEVRPGMTLLAALQRNNIVPESVIATRAGEMILEDEILKDGDVIKLIAVISGG
jgi:sulfur carrier protein ThiS